MAVRTNERPVQNQEFELLIREVEEESRRRRRILVRRTVAVLAVIAILAMVAALLVGVATAPRRTSTRKSASPPVVHSRGGRPIAEVYAIPTGGPRDWGLYFRTTVGGGHARFLTTGISAPSLPAQGASRSTDFTVYGTTHHPAVFSVSPDGRLVELVMPSTVSLGSVLLSRGGDVYAGSNAGRLLVFDVRTRRLVKYFSDFSSTESLVFDGNEPIALGSRCLGFPGGGGFGGVTCSAGIANIATHAARTIPGAGYLQGAVLGPDGDIYTVVWNPNQPERPIHVLRIDPRSLQVVSTFDTGVVPRQNLAADVVLDPNAGVLVYVVQTRSPQADTPQHSYLWRASRAGLQLLTPLPVNVGLFINDISGNVLLYGGGARNEVSEYNTARHAFTHDVPGLTTPAGTYVQAVL